MVSSILLYILMLIVPSVMIIYGGLSWYNGLKNRNSIISYHSKKARKNQETWIKANSFFGKLMCILGIVLFVLVPALIYYLSTIQALNGFSETVILLVEVICFLSVFYITELLLEKKAKDNKEE